MKQRSLQLIDEGWEMEDVANVLGVASKSIRRWTDNYDMHGRVDPPSVLRGRPHILNSEAISDLHELIRGTPTLFLDEIGDGSHCIMINQSQPKCFWVERRALSSIGLRGRFWGCSWDGLTKRAFGGRPRFLRMTIGSSSLDEDSSTSWVCDCLWCLNFRFDDDFSCRRSSSEYSAAHSTSCSGEGMESSSLLTYDSGWPFDDFELAGLGFDASQCSRACALTI
jgi:hypothetical protein